VTVVGSDTGGTFTDLVLDTGAIVKVPSVRDDPAEAVHAGLAALLGASVPDGDAGAGSTTPTVILAHGTTVATNALLERRGARVALVTNEGFADVIEIARQDRPSLYDNRVDRPPPLVPRAWRYEVRGRLGPDGRELEPLDLSTLPEIDPTVEVVAVCLLHSDLDPSHERAVAAELARRGFDVTASHEVSPEMREYERTATTVINAYVRPVCRTYLGALAREREVLVMTSAAGLARAADAAERPAALLLSGPAGGALAGAAAAVANGYRDAITFDMGGTSTDVCLVHDGRPEPASEREVAGFPVRLPSLDVHTIGAGGGSIAHVDDGGALVVGPRSAGAVPGPACYGRGGTEPTVTDADLVDGRIPADADFGGLRLDRAAAERALAGAGVAASEVIAVVEAAMVQALRVVSVERGVDPRSMALVAFGGAGPLHACALADALDMPAVIVPARAGVLSAVGILGASMQVDRVASWATPLDHRGLDAARAELAGRADEELRGWIDRLGGARAAVGNPADAAGLDREAPVVTALVDCRYAGQSHALSVPEVGGFEDEHERRNGYRRPGTPIEVVALRASVRTGPLVDTDALGAPARASAAGPCVLAEPDCTIWVPEGWRAEPGAAGALVLTRAAGGANASVS
jgi:N-methylhydantoinase A/oxoprolinase/acetone carboxylase beta subunit